MRSPPVFHHSPFQVFAAIGIIKLSFPIERLVESMAWVESVPTMLVRIIGACELLGGCALMLPYASRPAARATSLVALGFTLLMSLAAIIHLARGELRMLPVNFVLGALAVFVAWGQLRPQR